MASGMATQFALILPEHKGMDNVTGVCAYHGEEGIIATAGRHTLCMLSEAHRNGYATCTVAASPQVRDQQVCMFCMSLCS